MSEAKEPNPGDLYHGVECAKCGERTQPNDLKKAPDGFLVICKKCQHEQVYPLSELKRFDWFPSGD